VTSAGLLGVISAGFKENLTMRSTCMVLLALLVACGDDKLKPDASPPDSPIDPSDGIAAARAAAECMTTIGCPDLRLGIFRVTVTSVRPQIIGNGNPAGFTIQAQQMGPALFVGVDPTTLTPPLHVGDVVSFTITGVSHLPEHRATSLRDLTVVQTGTDVTPLLKDISSSTALGYDAELVTVTGTVASNLRGSFSGPGFAEVQLDTAGIQGNPKFVVRGPSALLSGVDMTMGCHITISKAPFIIYTFFGEGSTIFYNIGVYGASDYTLTGCAPPKIQLAVALSATSVKLTFDRNIKESSVMADGSQFTFDNGLTASAATVSGKTITLTTSAQSPRTNYTMTVANSVTDLQGSSVAAGTMFTGFDTPAIVRINEFNANLTCPLIELRVVQGGPMTGFQITERSDSSFRMSLTFTNFIVQTNDLIVVHAHNNATCNPGTSTNETVAVNEQPKAMFAANFDTAYDWYANDGLKVMSSVITLFDAGGTIVDAVFLTDGLPNVFSATLTAAGLVGAANQWTPAKAIYDMATFLSAAVDKINATIAGTSIQRIDNNDTNAKADWTTGAGLPSTWGALNVGQTAFP